MPLRDALLIACKNGLVELTAEIVAAEQDRTEGFVEAVRERLFEHAYLAMTDPAILDPDSLALSSVLFSRDPLPEAHREGLASLAFEPIDRLDASAEKGRRTQLERWRAPYLRARDVSSALAAFEAELLEDSPPGPFAAIAPAAAAALIAAAREAFGLHLATDVAGLAALDTRFLDERGRTVGPKPVLRGRLVLQPAAIRAMAAFAGEAIRRAAPDSTWSRDPDEASPLYIRARGGGIVRSDPELRAVQLVAHGRKAMLSAYAEAVIKQSIVAADSR